MPTSVVWNGTTYSIPAAGETNWANLSNFLIALANNAQTTSKQITGIRTALTTPVTVAAATDFCVVTNLSVAGAVAVTLPTGVNGQIFAIVDGKGDAGTNNITISGTAQNINGAASYVINTGRGAVLLQFSTTESQWIVLAATGGSSGGGASFPVRTALTSPVTIAASDFCVMTNLTTPGAVAVNLPAGVDGTVYAIVDAKGDAATNNITITPNSGNINGASTYVISRNKGGVLIQYNTTETQWKILAEYSDAQAHINASTGVHGVSGAVVGTTDSQTITNKALGSATNVLTGATAASFDNSGATITLPTSASTLATLALSETLTNKNLANSNNTLSGATATSFTNSGTVTLPSGVETLVGRATTDTLTNKDIDGGTASNTNRITLPKADTATLAGLTDKEATVAYDTDLDQVVVNNGSAFVPVGSSGSGSGEVNAILNPSAATNTDGWTAATNYTITRDTSNSPLAPIISTCFAASTTTASAESSTSGDYYVLTLPTGLENKKLKLDIYCTVPATADGVWVVSVYDGTTRLSLSTDSSGATTLPGGFTGKFTTYFDTTANNTYTVSFTQTTRTNANTLYVTGLVFGPGIQPQGAVISPWTSFTPTGSWSTNTTYSGRYRTVGSQMEIQYRLDTAGAPTSANLTLNMPTGYTIDTTAMPSPNTASILPSRGSIRDAGTATFDAALMYASTSSFTAIAFGVGSSFSTESTINQANPMTWASGDSLFITVTVPVAELAGAATVNLAQNDVEYASNSNSTSTATDTTSFAYGQNGSLIPNASTGTTYRRRSAFQTPAQASGVSIVEVDLGSGGAAWVPATHVFPYVRQGSSEFGIGYNTITSTYIEIDFMSGGAFPSNATYAGTGAPWSNYAAWRWRIVKAASGTAVGFGAATSTSSGLVDTQSQTFGGRKSAGNSKVVVRRSTDQSIGAGTTAKLQMATEDVDTNGEYDNATNYRLTPTRAGYWQVSATVRGESVGAANYFQAFIYKNGSLYNSFAGSRTANTTGGAETMYTSVSALIQVNGTTDYIEVFVNNQAGTINYQGMMTAFEVL